MESAERFRVEVLFSPGAGHNPFEVIPIKQDHTLPIALRTPLHRGAPLLAWKYLECRYCLLYIHESHSSELSSCLSPSYCFPGGEDPVAHSMHARGVVVSQQSCCLLLWQWLGACWYLKVCLVNWIPAACLQMHLAFFWQEERFTNNSDLGISYNHVCV